MRDRLGSVVGLRDEEGRMVQRYAYDSYGNPMVKILRRYYGGSFFNPEAPIQSTAIADPQWQPLSQAAGDENYIPVPFNFTGREYDLETGLYYYRARYYDPVIGRFLTEDPVWSPNLYAFVNNNPVNAVDPYGLFLMNALNTFFVFIGNIYSNPDVIATMIANISKMETSFERMQALLSFADSHDAFIEITPGVAAALGIDIEGLVSFADIDLDTIVIGPENNLGASGNSVGGIEF